MSTPERCAERIGLTAPLHNKVYNKAVFALHEENGLCTELRSFLDRNYSAA